MKIYLDACTIIYWVEMAEPQYSKFVDIIHHVKKKFKTSTFAASHLSLLECRVQPMREKNDALLKLYQQFFCAGDLELIPVSAQILEKAAELRAYYNIRTPDAIQAASALTIAEGNIFVTADKSFKKINDLLEIVLI